MKIKSGRRLAPSERPARIPTTRTVVDKRTKANKRSVLASATRRAVRECA